MKQLLLLIATGIFINSCYAQTLKGTIYYDLGNAKKKIGSGLAIYLIPNNANTATVVNKISSYEVACDEKLIKTVRDYKVAITDKSGYYYFNNILPGAYLLKICTYYGGFYKFTIKARFTGTLTLPPFEADPPIK